MPAIQKIALIFTMTLNLCACSSTNHIGNPLTLPGRAMINGVENTIYASRRNTLKDYVTANQAEIYRNINARGGPVMTQAMDIVRIEQERRAPLLSELSAHPDIYQQADIEPLIVALMVHGN